MELEDVQRRIQFRQGSYMVTIPIQIVHALGMRKNQYVRFAISKNKVIIKPVDAGITKKDVAEADKDSAVLDKYDSAGNEGYHDELAEALGRKPDGKDSKTDSRMEKLRMR